MMSSTGSEQWGLYRRYLRRYLRPHLPRAGVLLVNFLIAIGLELWLPRILAHFIDQAAAGEPLDHLIRNAAIFLAAGFLSQLATVGETYLATDIGLHATNHLRTDLVRHCLRLDLSFHNARTPGELIERVDGDAGVLNQFFSRFVVQIVGNLFLLVGVLVLLFGIDVRVGAALTAFALVTMSLLSRLSTIGIPHWNMAKEARAQYFGFIEERLSGTEDLRANGGVAYAMRRLAESARAYFRKDLLADGIATTAFGSTILLFSVGGAIALGLAAWIYLEGTITLGTAFLIFGYTQLLTRPIESIIRELDDLQQAGASLRRVSELLSLPARLEDGSEELPAGPLSVGFQSVTFTYPDAGEQAEDTAVLRGISFELQAGRVLGLLGRTGSGKTTLTRLLFRLYDPQEGQVLLNGISLQSVRNGAITARIGVVTQDVQLFNASIRDNLTFFDTSVSDDRIRQALAALDLLEWVDSFPEGLDTSLKSGGEGLSAGEAQLLAFTRVFLKDPGLVILDEASSRLDPATESLLERAIARLLQGRTGVIIAHRLETVQRSDEVMILEQGRIVEHGRRMDLLKDPGSRFSGLLQTGLEQEMV